MKYDLLRDYQKKKFCSKKILNHFVMNNGIAHIMCEVKAKEEIVNPFGVPGLEILADGFAAYIDEIALSIPDSAPVLVELIGCKFTDKEKEDIEVAFWNHYALFAYNYQKLNRRGTIRFIWFAICLIAITLLIFLTYDSSNNQIWLNILFLGFYFFGDGVIREPLLDNRVIERDRMASIQLSCAKLVFSEDKPLGQLSDEQANQIVEEIKGYLKHDEL